MLECKGMGRVHSGFYGALFNGDEEQGRLFDDLVGSIHSADAGKGKAIYLTGVSYGRRPALCPVPASLSGGVTCRHLSMACHVARLHPQLTCLTSCSPLMTA